MDPLEQTSREFAFIRKGDEAQMELRMLYNTRRLRSLGANATGPTDARSVFEDCVATVRQKYPDFVPDVDPRLFESE